VFWSNERSLKLYIIKYKILGIIKNFTIKTDSDVSALKLTFVAAGISQKEQIEDSDNEALGKLEPRPKGRIPVLKNVQLRIYSFVELD